MIRIQHNRERDSETLLLLLKQSVSLKQGHVISNFSYVTTVFWWSILVVFLVDIVSVLISSCSATLGPSLSWVWEQVSARGSRGSGQWPVTSGGWWPVPRGSVWSGARWRTLGPGPGSVTSLRWEQRAGATFRAQSLGSITLQANNYHNTIPRSRTSVMINLIVLTHWALHGTSLQICEI